MRDPQVFYNKEDVWEIARDLFGQSGQPEPVAPTYVVATLAGRERSGVPADSAFQPARQRQPDRVDGGSLRRRQLGKLVFFQLLEQQLMYGPHAD